MKAAKLNSLSKSVLMFFQMVTLRNIDKNSCSNSKNVRMLPFCGHLQVPQLFVGITSTRNLCLWESEGMAIKKWNKIAAGLTVELMVRFQNWMSFFGTHDVPNTPAKFQFFLFNN